MPFLKPRVEQSFIPIIGLVFLTATLLLQGQSSSSSVVTTSGASPEAVEAASKLSVLHGFNLEIYASEPLLANPVSIALVGFRFFIQHG
jgi:hypothetical protein